jgi:osmotically-inducible protein OsmY
LQQKGEAALIDTLGVDFRQLEVMVEKGIVALRGGLGSHVKKDNLEKMICTLEGVKGVECHLSVLRTLW